MSRPAATWRRPLAPLRRPATNTVARALVVAVPVFIALVLARPLVGAPLTTVGAILGIAVVLVLLLHVEWAALLFVAAEPFADYARAVSGSAVKGLGAMLVAAWLVRVAAPGLVRRPHPPLSGPAPRRGLSHPVAFSGFVLVGVLLASTVAHSNGSAGVDVLIRYLSFLGALIVLIDCLYDRLPLRRVAAVFVTSCTAAAVVGLVNYLIRGAPRAGGPLSDPNDFAFFLVAALPLALVLRRGARRPWAWDVASVLIALAMAATLSRGALFAVLAMIVFAVLNGVVRVRVIGAVLATLVVLLTALSISDPGIIQNSLTQKEAVASQNVDDRLTRWRVAAEMTVDYPVLGDGPGGFKTNYPHYVDLSETDPLHVLDVAHETYLEVSAELGLLGLGAFLAVLSYGFAGAYRRSRIPDDGGRLAGGVCASIIGAGVAAVFLTEQYYLPLWMLAAFGAALDPRHRSAGGALNQIQHNVATMVKGRGAR